MAQRRSRAAEVQGSLSAASSLRSRVLRLARSGDADRAGGSRARIRHPWVLLLLLLVQRQAAARAAARRSAAIRPTRFSLLRVLGERELDAPLGRRRPRCPHRAAVLAGGRRAPDRGPRAVISRSALHPDRRPAAPRRLPREPAARRARERSALSRARAAGRAGRSLSRVRARARAWPSPGSWGFDAGARVSSAQPRGLGPYAVDGNHRSAISRARSGTTSTAPRPSIAQPRSGLPAPSRHHGRLGQHGAPAQQQQRVRERASRELSALADGAAARGDARRSRRASSSSSSMRGTNGRRAATSSPISRSAARISKRPKPRSIRCADAT